MYNRPVTTEQTYITTNYYLNRPITLFGDSISKGLYLDNKRIKRIEHSAVDILSEEYGIKVDNFSSFGQTLKKCFEKGYFDRYLNERTNEHDTLVIELGGNDSDYNWEEAAQSPFEEHLPNTPLNEFESILDTLIKKLKKNGVSPVFLSLPPVDSQRYFKNVICGRADGERVMQFLCGDVTNIARHQETYNTAILKKALENGCEFIDFRTEFLLMIDFLDCLSDDGIHPNQKGHEAIAKIIGKRLEKFNTKSIGAM